MTPLEIIALARALTAAGMELTEYIGRLRAEGVGDNDQLTEAQKEVVKSITSDRKIAEAAFDAKFGTT